MDLQEAIIRGRFIFNDAPKRLEVFKNVNGKNNTKEIARKVGKTLIATLNDLKKMEGLEIINPKKDSNGNILKKDKSLIYEKSSLFNAISIKYFENQEKGQSKIDSESVNKKTKNILIKSIVIPSENQILDICKYGEDQLYEFKQSGVETEKITREIGAFLNTKLGGIIFYGVDDSGTILGSDKTRQNFDQSLQNSIKHNIDPLPVIKLVEKSLIKQKILLIIVPPWNKKHVYQFKERVLLRKGTNVFSASPEELKKLHDGKYVI
jgi:hypothetical protein